MKLADKKGRIVAICISEKRGTKKIPVTEARLIPEWGIETDAHGGRWHRQVSLLPLERIEEFRAKGADVVFGDFGENIVTEGIDLGRLEVGTVFCIGEARLRLTQIEKECHSHCEIYKRMQDCIMPREGVFAEVTEGGSIKTGDLIKLEEPDRKRLTAAVITLSDRSFRGEREDKSGPLAAEMLKKAGYDVVEELLLPDEKEALKKELIRLCDGRQVCLVITTGGTGFSPRDITPEATAEVWDRPARGIAEAIRAYSMTITKRAMLSRGESGIRGRSLIVNLPGSPKAVEEALSYILSGLKHGIEILRGKTE